MERTPSLAVKIGVIAAAVTAVLLSMGVATLGGFFGNGDATAHADYAIRVWHGDLPEFEEGVEFKPEGAVVPAAQYEAHHPPLHYLIMAPVAGPLADAGYPDRAGLAMQLVNSLITGLIVLAVGWGAYWMWPTRPSGAVVAAGVAATLGPVLFTGCTVYSDPIMTLLAVLAAGLGLKMLRRGLSVRLVAWAALVAALGCLARASFILPFATLLVCILAAPLVAGSGQVRRRLAHGVLACTATVLAAAAASGWFWWRNHELTGNFQGGHPEWAAKYLARESRTPLEVLQLDQFWNTQISLLRHPLDGKTAAVTERAQLDEKVMIALFLGLVAIGTIATLVYLVRALVRRQVADLAVAAALGFLMAVTLVFEVQYMTGGGGSISRYLLPAVLPISVLVASALRSVPAVLTPVTLALYLFLCHGFFLWWWTDRPRVALGDYLDQPGVLQVAVLVIVPLVVVSTLVHVAAMWFAVRAERTPVVEPAPDAVPDPVAANA